MTFLALTARTSARIQACKQRYSLLGHSISIHNSKIKESIRFFANCSSTYCRWHNTTTLDVIWRCHGAPATIDTDGFGYSQTANITSMVDVVINGLSTPRQAILSLKASPKIPENSTFNPPDYSNLVSPENRTTAEDKKDIVFKAPCSGQGNGNICDFNITRQAHLAVRKALTDFTAGLLYRDPSRNGTLFIRSSPVMDLFTWLWRTNLALVAKYPNPLNTTLSFYTLNAAWGLSGYIRTKQATQLDGKNGSFEPILNIEWKYTIYPGVILIMTLYLFAFTVRATRDMPVWKSSLLPSLHHGFDRPVLGWNYDLSSLPWMEGFSKEKRVVLWDAGDGLGLRPRGTKRDNADGSFQH
ncbi:hypothetical protein RB213_004876 [Colletotrichum asianum]